MLTGFPILSLAESQKIVFVAVLNIFYLTWAPLLHYFVKFENLKLSLNIEISKFYMKLKPVQKIITFRWRVLQTYYSNDLLFCTVRENQKSCILNKDKLTNRM